MTEATLLLIIGFFVSCIIGYSIWKHFYSRLKLNMIDKEYSDVLFTFHKCYDEREEAFQQFFLIRKKFRFFEEKLGKEKKLLLKARKAYRKICVEKNLEKGNSNELSEKMIMARNAYFEAKRKYQKTFKAFWVIKEKEKKSWENLKQISKKTRSAKKQYIALQSLKKYLNEKLGILSNFH